MEHTTFGGDEMAVPGDPDKLSLNAEVILVTGKMAEPRRKGEDEWDDTARDSLTSVSFDDTDSEDPYQPVWKELWCQLCLSSPLSLCNLLQFSISIVSVAFVGHLGTLELSSAALGTAFANISTLSVLIGLSFVLDTYCTQYFGAGRYADMGIVCQRILLIQVVAFVPLAVLNCHVEALLLLLAQPADIAHGAAQFAALLMPAVFIQGTTQVAQRYLQAQGQMRPMLYAAALAMAVHVPATWALVRRLGFRGAALANAVSNLVVLGLMVACAARSPAARHWPGWGRASLRGWGRLLRLAVPGLAMLVFEWWSFELQILLAGRLPHSDVSVGACAIIFSCIQVTFSLPYGLSCTASTRVGNELGAARPLQARRSAATSAALCCALVASEAALLLTFRSKVGRWFAGNRHSSGEGNEGEDDIDAEVELVGSTIPFLCVIVMFDGSQAVLSGILRACGKQVYGGIINALAYGVVGIPSCIGLAFYLHWGVHGLWAGLGLAVFTQALGQGLLVCVVDWRKESAAAMQRSEVAPDDDSGAGDEDQLGLVSQHAKYTAVDPGFDDL